MKKLLFFLLVVLLPSFAFASGGCGASSTNINGGTVICPTAEPTWTPADTATPITFPTRLATQTPIPYATPLPYATPIPYPTAVFTATIRPFATAIPTQTAISIPAYPTQVPTQVYATALPYATAVSVQPYATQVPYATAQPYATVVPYATAIPTQTPITLIGVTNMLNVKYFTWSLVGTGATTIATATGNIVVKSVTFYQSTAAVGLVSASAATNDTTPVAVLSSITLLNLTAGKNLGALNAPFLLANGKAIVGTTIGVGTSGSMLVAVEYYKGSGDIS